MSPYTPGTDIRVERWRLEGMLLSAVLYGIFSLLTVQATVTLIQRSRHGGRIVHHRWMAFSLVSYVWFIFILATIEFAVNVRYAEMIWIYLRDVPGGAAALILDELKYRINAMALTCYYIMEWFMQVLLLYRYFTLLDWKKHVIVPMSTLFAVVVTMSALAHVESSGAFSYNINSEFAYLCLQVGLTIIYILLVASRLFYLKKMRETLGSKHVRPHYETMATMVVESAALYSVLSIIFIASFTLHSNVFNPVLLSVSHVQGIAQWLIIIRLARGRASQYSASQTRPVHSLTPSTLLGTLSSERELEHTSPLTRIAGMVRGTRSSRPGAKSP